MMLPTNAVTVRQNLSTANNESGVTEALNQILRELQYLNFVVKQLPWHLNTGIALPDDEELFKQDPQLTIK
jgi:ABC-type transport system involved in cytochrome bd biosynthesis fused ATPase/permease subunit